MISVKQAKKIINSSISSIKSEKINVNDGLGRVLSLQIKSTMDSPPFDMSSMDGYAIKYNKKYKKSKYKVIENIYAGDTKSSELKEGETIRIFTGGKIPKGCNVIILQENVKKLKNNYIQILEINASINYIRKKSQDFKKGSILFKKNHIITTRDIALLISSGIENIIVYKKPNVAVLATGDELVLPGKKLKPGQIYASSLFMLKKLISLSGCNCEFFGLVKDNKQAIKNSLKKLNNIDLIITTGGVSVGDKDLIKLVLLELGMIQKFWKVKVKPGKPLLFGMYSGTPVFGLPGNPVSTYVCYLLFVTEAIKKMLNNDLSFLKKYKVILSDKLENSGIRETYFRGKVYLKNNKEYVNAINNQDSSLLKNLSYSNCLIKVLPNKIIKKNEYVEIYKFSELI